MLLPTPPRITVAVYERQGFSEMLQLVARLGRPGSLGLPNPTLGDLRCKDKPCLIFEEYNTLNPATFRPLMVLYMSPTRKNTCGAL